MEDKHFLLQNTLTGIILLVFFIGGLRIFNEKASFDVINFFFNNWKNLSVLILSPIIGIIIQGIWMLIQYKILRNPYRGKLRKYVAELIRTAIQSMDGVPDNIKHSINKSSNNSLFAWLIYADAPPSLIEWGRRMRDFQHLGENWATAGILGILIGSICALVRSDQIYSIIPFIISIISIIWIIGLFFLRKKMKEDVEGMEITWFCSFLCQDLRERIKPLINSAINLNKNNL